MEYNPLANLIKNNFIPTVLVICTPEVEQICKKNGKTFSKLLESIPTRVGDQKIFQLRFITVPEIENRCVLPDQIDKYEAQVQQNLNNFASHYSSDKIYGDFVLREAADVPFLQRTLSGKDPTPWFAYYRWEYIRSLGLSDFEFFEHPIACLLAVSSDVDNPVDAVNKLFDDRHPPAPFKNGHADPNIPKFYVLVHDNQTEFNADKKLVQLRTTFEKTKVQMIKVNSSTQKNEKGTFLTVQDMQGLEAYLKELIHKGIIPYMEKSVAALNDFVEVQRKGITSALKGLLGLGKKKEKPENPEYIPVTQGNGLFPFNSAKSCQKRVADYLFMMSDYGEALNLYKTAAKDYLNDKAWKYHAAASEMCALCTYMLDPTRKDIDSYLESAYLFYLKDNCGRNSVRVTFFFSDLLRVRRNLPEASSKLIRAAERENDKLCAAFLSEQAAFCHLYSNPPQLRRYTFRLVTAGHFFHLVAQHKHSYRCYASAYPVYESHNWMFIDDNMHFNLAKTSFTLGNLENAALYIQRLLEKNYQPPVKQSSYLLEFLHIVNKASQEKQVVNPILPVPVIINETATVFLRDHPPKSPMQEMWKAMEKDLKNEGKKKKQVKWKPAKERKKPTPRLCVVGETIFIDVDIRNPLGIPLQFTNMQLIGTHTVEGVVEQVPDLNNNGNPAFQVTPFDLLLGPRELKRLRFTVVPLKEGILTITAIGFQLQSLGTTLWGCREFKLPQKRLNDTSEQRRGVIYEPNLDFTIKVTSPMPLMDVEIPNFPLGMKQGQIQELLLELKNSGKSSLKNVKVKLSNPSFFSFGECDDSKSINTDEDISIVHLPIEKLSPNESVRIPVWIRAHKVGTFSFNFLFFYQSEEVNTEMPYRLHRLTRDTIITPSVKTVTSSNFSHSNINAYLLNLEITNVQDSSYTFQKLSAYSPNWVVQPLSYPDKEGSDDMFTVAGSQSTNLFFRITPLKQGENQDASKLYGTHLTFPNKEIGNASFSFPYFDFLRREKCFLSEKKKKSHREREALFGSRDKVQEIDQDTTNTMDFILLWQAVDSLQGVVYGQCNICNVSFLTPTTVEQSSPENSALRFSIESPRKVVHDFNKECFCVVPVTFNISCNRSAQAPISVTLETLRPSEQSENVSGHRPSFLQKKSQFFWAGVTQHFVPQLKPDEHISIQTAVCFSRPGVYNINKYKFVLKDSVKKTLLQQIYAPIQHLISVEEENELPSDQSLTSSTLK